MAVPRFFASPLGHWLRAIVGLALLAYGYYAGSTWALIIGGLFVLVALVNVCALAVPFGGPFNGRSAHA